MRSQILSLFNRRLFYPLTKKFIGATNLSTEVDPDKKPDAKAWRKPWSQREGEWYSILNLFAPEKGISPDLTRLLQSTVNFDLQSMRKWFKKMKREKDVMDMRFIPERLAILGSELAAAHFLVHRGAAVRFVHSPKWIKKVEEQYDLPDRYDSKYVIEAIDSSDMKLLYEGFKSMENLSELKWLSLRNSNEINDWCLDKISGEYQSTLEYLDVSNCSQVTERGIGALYRMRKLRTLKVNNISESKAFQLTCLMLEELNPHLKIEGVTYEANENCT